MLIFYIIYYISDIFYKHMEISAWYWVLGKQK
jgi:hypothetical protein